MPYGFVHIDDPFNHKGGKNTGPKLVFVPPWKVLILQALVLTIFVMQLTETIFWRLELCW